MEQQPHRADGTGDGTLIRPIQPESVPRRRSSAPLWAVLALSQLTALTSCGESASSVVEPILLCSDVGWLAVRADIRDQDGRPAAVGATVHLEDEKGFEYETWGFWSPEHVFVGDGARGVFRMTVTKPYHTAVVVNGVEALGDGPPCPHRVSEPTPVSVVIVRDDDAPPVRQVVVKPGALLFLDGNITYPTPIPHLVEADAGLSTDVTWVSRDTTVVRVLPDARPRSVCGETRRTTWLVASAVADPAVQDSFLVGVQAMDPDRGYCP